jgi:hypothetical protein
VTLLEQVDASRLDRGLSKEVTADKRDAYGERRKDDRGLHRIRVADLVA